MPFVRLGLFGLRIWNPAERNMATLPVTLRARPSAPGALRRPRRARWMRQHLWRRQSPRGRSGTSGKVLFGVFGGAVGAGASCVVLLAYHRVCSTRTLLDLFERNQNYSTVQYRRMLRSLVILLYSSKPSCLTYITVPGSQKVALTI